MADENTTTATTGTGTTATPKRAAAKRKTTTARKAPGRPRAASKSETVKTIEKVESKARTYKRRATKAANAYERDAEKAADKLATRARAVSRNAFLASLGFYGKAYDKVQARLDSMQDRLDERSKAAKVAYADLVSRGSKVEKHAKGLISEIELPRL